MARPTTYPWIDHRVDDTSICPQGGIVVPFTAAAALNTGDVVFLSAAGTVNKSAVAANYTAFMGVVVGGKQLYGEVLDARYNQTAITGVLAANANDEVLVQVSGIAKVVAAAAVAVGGLLQVMTTSGQVDDPVVVAGQVVGTAIDAAAGAAVTIRMLIDHR